MNNFNFSSEKEKESLSPREIGYVRILLTGMVLGVIFYVGYQDYIESIAITKCVIIQAMSGAKVYLDVPACNTKGTPNFGEKIESLINLSGKWRVNNGHREFSCNGQLTEALMLEGGVGKLQTAERMKPIPSKHIF